MEAGSSGLIALTSRENCVRTECAMCLPDSGLDSGTGVAGYTRVPAASR
jgi:hypothetical protein